MNILLTYLSNRKKEGTRFLGTLACLCGLMSTQMAMAQDFYVTPDGKAPVDYNGSPIDGAWSSTDKAKLVTLKDALQQAQPVSRKSVKIVSITGRFIWHLKRAGH